VSGQLEIHGVRVDGLAPWVVEDVCKAKQCEVDNMLEYILRCASKKPDERYAPDSRVLLDRCLNKVLPICNGQSTYVEKFLISSIRAALIAY